MKNAKKFLEKITQKISEKEASRLYFDLIILDIIKLQKAKSSRHKNRRKNILGVLEKLGSVFTKTYPHYYSTSELESESKSEIKQSEENIAERTKLRRQRFDEIAEREKMINPELMKYYFTYLSPSNMYKKWRCRNE